MWEYIKIFLTSRSSASNASKPGIPLPIPLGPVLTYFSLVVVVVRVGEIDLEIIPKLNYWGIKILFSFIFPFYNVIIKKKLILHQSFDNIRTENYRSFIIDD